MTTFIKGAVKVQDYPETRAEVVFAGKSNVGKSSLINALYGNKTAYVGKTPGKTRMINFFDIDGKYTIADVPGYGYAKRSASEIESFGKMLEDYFGKRNNLKLCVLILDSRHLPTEDDKDMIEYLKHYEIPYVIVLNKIDKMSNNQLFNSKRAILKDTGLEDNDVFCVSCISKKGIPSLKDFIVSAIC